MKTRNHEARHFQDLLAHCFNNMRKVSRRSKGLILLLAIALIAACSAANAQTLIGTPGAGWQTWSVTPISYDQPDLNDSGAPWWDLQWAAAGSYGSNSSGADKNPGFCITATGDCVGVGSGALAPGAIPFWALTYYDPVNDSGGARDNNVYFNSKGGSYVAVLYLNATASPDEVNAFGWFETNKTGTLAGTKHQLFSGTGVTKDQIPTKTGTVVVFTPSTYFGYYYSDVSEPACPDGTPTTYADGVHPCADPNAVTHGCYAYTLFGLNDQKCTQAGGEQGDHDFVIFSKNPKAALPTYWVAGEDPSDCFDQDGDCNLTLVSVTKI